VKLVSLYVSESLSVSLFVCLRVFVCLALCMSASLFDGREALDRLVFFLVFKSEVLYR
jgi:hypothetical protein